METDFVNNKEQYSSIRSDAKKTYKQLNAKEKKNRFRLNFTAEAPNIIWVSDTSYFTFAEKTYYICAIVDLYSLKVIAHKISSKHSTQLTAGTFKLAYIQRNPPEGLIFQSDRGVQKCNQATHQNSRRSLTLESGSPGKRQRRGTGAILSLRRSKIFTTCKIPSRYIKNFMNR